MDISNLRLEFPQLEQTVYGKPLIYLDNAATSLRSHSVIAKWNEISEQYNSNLHRAVHYCASKATDEYESTRDFVQKYLNAKYREEIIFTSGVTQSINLVASSFSQAFLKENDEIIVSEAEHHSNIVPWQLACERIGAKLKVLQIEKDGTVDLENLNRLLNPKTKLLAITHISNVLGIVNPIKNIVNICHSNNCRVLVDGAQGIVHSKLDVQDLNCDFYAFSGHKMFAAPGTGVLYGKKELLESMPPYMGGGEMVGTVTFEKTTYAPLPQKFEAGTQNISGTPTLKPAIELLQLFNNKEYTYYCEFLKEYVFEKLKTIDGLHIVGEAEPKIPLFSFYVEHIHHEDLALILDKMGIAVRSGQMCAEPLMNKFGVTGLVRASFLPYNTIEEAEIFISSLKKAINMLK